MPPILNLVVTAQEQIAAINAAVMSICPEARDRGWTAVVRELADDHSFLSLSLATKPGERIPTCLLEFGAQAEGERRVIGWLSGGWLKEEGCLEGVDEVVMEGRPAALDAFLKGLALYKVLPTIGCEVDHG